MSRVIEMLDEFDFWMVKNVAETPDLGMIAMTYPEKAEKLVNLNVFKPIHENNWELTALGFQIWKELRESDRELQHHPEEISLTRPIITIQDYMTMHSGWEKI